MAQVTHVQILDEVVCFSHITVNLNKDMTPIILLPLMNKEQNGQSSLALIWQPDKKENSELKHVKHPLITDFAHTEELVNI